MRKTLLTAVAVSVLGLATSAFAEDAQLYVHTDAATGKRIIMGGTNPAGVELRTGENGAKPSDCPAGQYWENAQHMVVSCDDEAMQFSQEAPEAGAMMPDNQPYPEGSMLLKRSGG
jgi:hypothetical protein